MTHEELLKKINIFLVATELQSVDEDFVGTKMLKAIRAVVELHKPMEASHIPKPWFACKHCSGYDAENIYVGYPCSTIQAIEEALK